MRAKGLLFYGSTILPFVDRFPKDTELYQASHDEADLRARIYNNLKGTRNMENMITVFENEEFGAVRTAIIEDGRALVCARTTWRYRVISVRTH